ncbi:hypothetical protein C1H46_041197 [Malus baccata]|uniref:Uncharacterized protein n=1 Tax=Malus baccata TaxID=106549 RepID=A0A540KGJ1_MALBA|nr:hypothetical protein C1H46_041197 [Malus baccata]
MMLNLYAVNHYKSLSLKKSSTILNLGCSMAASNLLVNCLCTLQRDQAIRSSQIQFQLISKIIQVANNH